MITQKHVPNEIRTRGLSVRAGFRLYSGHRS